MARPAGYSDDEWDSDEGGMSFSDDFSRHKKPVTVLYNELTQEERLINAILGNKIEEVKVLVQNGADVNYKPNKFGWTPLMQASSLGKRELIEYLLKQGANPNIHVKMSTSLMCLCDSNNYDQEELLHCLNLLVGAGSDINAYNVYRETPLMFAADRGFLELVTRLLELGSNINLTNCDGWSAIFYAVSKGNAEMVSLLIESGSNISMIDTKGQSLYDLATIKNQKDVLNLVAIDDISTSEENYYFPKKNLSNYKFVCSEMPSFKGSDFDGFSEDLVKTIYGLGMKNIISLFIENNIGYGTFLINKDENWKDLGIQMSFDRKKLITHAYDIIQKNWSAEVLIDRQSDSMNIFRIAQKLSNNVRIIYILVASCYVCNRELYKNNNEDLKKLQEVLNKAICEIKLLRATVSRLDRILERIERDVNLYPADFISHKSSLNQFLTRFPRKYFCLVSILALFGFTFFFKKSTIGLKNLVINFFWKII